MFSMPLPQKSDLIKLLYHSTGTLGKTELSNKFWDYSKDYVK